MAEFLNLQVYGVPIATYGLVGLTTAILAYATSISEMGETVSKSLTDITESPMASLSKMNPLASSSENPDKESEPSLFASTEKEPPGLEENEKSESPFTGLKGGKRRRNKTPKLKKSKNKEGKTKKNKSKSKK